MKLVLADSPTSGRGTFGHLGEPSVPFDQREWRGMSEERRGAGCWGPKKVQEWRGEGTLSVPSRRQAKS